MSEQLSSAHHYIDTAHPDYEQLAGLLHQYLSNSPSAEDISGLKGDSLVATVIWWAKEANQADPQAVVTEIFSPDAWDSKDWT